MELILAVNQTGFFQTLQNAVFPAFGEIFGKLAALCNMSLYDFLMWVAQGNTNTRLITTVMQTFGFYQEGMDIDEALRIAQSFRYLECTNIFTGDITYFEFPFRLIIDNIIVNVMIPVCGIFTPFIPQLANIPMWLFFICYCMLFVLLFTIIKGVISLVTLIGF